MKNVLLCVMVCLVSIYPVWSVESDPTDDILISYELSSSQEEMFDSDDGTLSGFWDAWDDDPDLDYIHELPSTHGARVFSPLISPENAPRLESFTSGEEDAQLFCRAAWGDKGLYLMIEILDDEFVGLVSSSDVDPDLDTDGGHKGAEYWMNDCVDFALDIYDSEEQVQHYVERQSQETFTYMQYQFRFGSPSAPSTTVRINYQNPNPVFDEGVGVHEQAGTYGWLLLFDELSFAEAKQKYGIHMEAVSTGERTMAQEWFFPWSKVATGMTKPTAGDRIALTMGYNDMDGSENTYPDVLFFKNYGNQFSGRKEWRGIDWAAIFGQVGENWGDIEFGSQLPQTGEEITRIGTSKLLHNSRLKNHSGVRYTSTGRMLRSQNTVSHSHGIVITETKAGIARKMISKM